MGENPPHNLPEPKVRVLKPVDAKALPKEWSGEQPSLQPPQLPQDVKDNPKSILESSPAPSTATPQQQLQQPKRKKRTARQSNFTFNSGKASQEAYKTASNQVSTMPSKEELGELPKGMGVLIFPNGSKIVSRVEDLLNYNAASVVYGAQMANNASDGMNASSRGKQRQARGGRTGYGGAGRGGRGSLGRGNKQLGPTHPLPIKPSRPSDVGNDADSGEKQKTGKTEEHAAQLPLPTSPASVSEHENEFLRLKYMHDNGIPRDMLQDSKTNLAEVMAAVGIQSEFAKEDEEMNDGEHSVQASGYSTPVRHASRSPSIGSSETGLTPSPPRLFTEPDAVRYHSTNEESAHMEDVNEIW